MASRILDGPPRNKPANATPAVRDGSDVEDGTKRMSNVEGRMPKVEGKRKSGEADGLDSHFAFQTSHFSRAGVVAERAFVAQRLGRVNVAVDDEVGVGGDWLKGETMELRLLISEA